MSQAFRARKRWGQHFLIDPGVPAAIAEAAELTPADRVLEIGPGGGALTRELAARAGSVVAVELDKRLAPELAALEAEFPQLRVVWADFLATSFPELGVEEAGCKVIANIPYYITTPILLKLLHADELERGPFAALTPRPARILLMVQEEVAARLLAEPGTKAYGSVTVLVRYAATVRRVLKVPRTAFRPKPQVDSAVIMLEPRLQAPVEVGDARLFSRVVRAAFNQRRKMLGNALKAAAFDPEALQRAFAAVGIDPQRRGETLSLEEFASLARQLRPAVEAQLS